MLKLAGELLEGQLADHIARLDAHTKKPREIFGTGEYILPLHFAFDGISATGISANTLYAVPFLAARDMTVDRIAFFTMAGQSGKYARLGIYKNGSNLYPGELLLDAGEVTLNAAEAKAITIDQALTKGLYWLALVADADPSPKVLVDCSTILGIGSGLGAANLQTGWQVSQTYGTLPDPFTSGGSFTTQHMKLIALRLKSLD